MTDYTLISLLAGDPSNLYIGTASIASLSTVVGTSTYTLAAATARAIAAGFAASVTKKSGDVSVNSSDKYDHYMKLAADLDKQAALRGLDASSVYAGGISQGDKETRENDTDRTQPYFTRTLLDAPGTLFDTGDTLNRQNE